MIGTGLMRKRTGTGSLSIPDPEENHIADLIPLIPGLIRDLLRIITDVIRMFKVSLIFHLKCHINA